MRQSLFSLILSFLFIATAARAGALKVPQGFSVTAEAGTPVLHWQKVEGAGLYRVAVFDAADAEGKRPLLAAVWLKGERYVYGQTLTVAKAAKLASTKPLPLPNGRTLRAMVAAARADGTDKSDWAGLDLEAPAKPARAVAPVTATPTPTPAPGKVTTTAEAEPELDGGEEFKQSPEAAVLDVEDALGEGSTAAAGATKGKPKVSPSSVSPAAAAATEKAQAPVPTPVPYTLEAAQDLVKQGKGEEAEAAYKRLLEKDPNSADAWEGLGDSYSVRKMKLEAKEAYEKALELNRDKTHLKTWLQNNVRH